MSVQAGCPGSESLRKKEENWKELKEVQGRRAQREFKGGERVKGGELKREKEVERRTSGRTL